MEQTGLVQQEAWRRQRAETNRSSEGLSVKLTDGTWYLVLESPNQGWRINVSQGQNGGNPSCVDGVDGLNQ